MGCERDVEDLSLSWIFLFIGSVACWIESAVGLLLGWFGIEEPFFALIFPGGWLVIPMFLLVFVGFVGLAFYLYELVRRRVRLLDHVWLLVFIVSFGLVTISWAWV